MLLTISTCSERERRRVSHSCSCASLSAMENINCEPPFIAPSVDVERGRRNQRVRERDCWAGWLIGRSPRPAVSLEEVRGWSRNKRGGQKRERENENARRRRTRKQHIDTNTTREWKEKKKKRGGANLPIVLLSFLWLVPVFLLFQCRQLWCSVGRQQLV